VNDADDRIVTSWRAIIEHLNPWPVPASHAATMASRSGTSPGGEGLAPA
jgi:hypothetical protein